MIAYAVCVGNPVLFTRLARPTIVNNGGPDHSIAEIETDSIFEGYNEALDAFRERDDIEAVVFVHEDVLVLESGLGQRLRSIFSDKSIAIAGAIGGRGVDSLCWWEGESVGQLSESRGMVGKRCGFQDVEVVDGCFLALSPWAVRNLRFDEETFHGFHAYDVDICFQALEAGQRVVVHDFTLHHAAVGGLGDDENFWTADRKLRAKWSARGREMMTDEERLYRRTRFLQVAAT